MNRDNQGRGTLLEPGSLYVLEAREGDGPWLRVARAGVILVEIFDGDAAKMLENATMQALINSRKIEYRLALYRRAEAT